MHHSVCLFIFINGIIAFFLCSQYIKHCSNFGGFFPHQHFLNSVLFQANQTFALLDRISEYAEKWLNVSEELRLYLSRNETVEHLDSIREVLFFITYHFVIKTQK